MMIDFLPEILDRTMIGIWAGIVLGLLFAISRRLLLIWSTLMDIERNTRK